MPSRETISLYYKGGTSDKVYHVQLEPSGTEWAVHVQYGRRLASSLRDEVKTSAGASYGAARVIYDKLVAEKKKKGYTAGPLAGKSLASAAPVALPLSLPALPSWSGFEDFYVEAATALGEPSTLKTAPQPHLVLLADIASGMQEGAQDAIACIKRLKTESGIPALLSREGQTWLDALDASLKSTSAATLWSACKRA